MTEQGKIPVPQPADEKKVGQSLFERAAGAFGLGDSGDRFKAAPVPRDLAGPSPRHRAGTRRLASEESAAEQASELAPAAAVPAPEGPIATPKQPVAAVAGEQASSGAVTETLPAVNFPDVHHAVDRLHLRQNGMIEPEGGVTALLEEFRIVKRQLLVATRDAQRSGPSARAQRVLICSPLPGEGKTFCATNLALALAAERDSEVVLVDADFAKPSILSTLGLPGGPGLMDALADPAIRVEDCVIGTDVPGLWVLPAGSQTAQDSEYLSSNRTEQVLDRLTQGAPNRMVIFDSPPALAASPAAELAKYVGQAVLIVRADATGQSAIEDALSLLSSCPDIKLLLNDANFSPSGRRFGAYYGYGE